MGGKMITISLDEYGEFEKEDTKPLFIAGIIFDDQDDEKEEWTERNRIKSYYKRVIADSGGNFQYPEDLHSNGDKKRDREVIKLVKSKVQETLPEFITKGTYQGETLNDDYERKIRERNRLKKCTISIMRSLLSSEYFTNKKEISQILLLFLKES